MLKVQANNVIIMDGKFVGRIEAEDAQPRRAEDTRPLRFFTASGAVKKTGYDVQHLIAVPLYIGGASNWKINPAFEAAIQEIIG